MTRKLSPTHVILESEPAGVCAFCRQFEELRPYGPRGERICFACMKKDEPAAKRQFGRLLKKAETVDIVVPDAVTVYERKGTCPACGYTLNASGGQGIPRPGDLTICMACHVYLTYTDAIGTVRRLSDMEWLALSREERIEATALRDKIRAFAARFGGVPAS
jgi:hypothetical protein